MNLYQCADCHHREIKSETILKCPICGKKNISNTAINKDTIIGLIIEEVNKIETVQITDEIIRKEKYKIDNKFFPSIEEIYKYALSSELSDDFFGKILNSLAEFDLFQNKTYTETYSLNLTNFYKKILDNNKIICDFISDFELGEFTFNNLQEHIINVTKVSTYDQASVQTNLELCSLLKMLVKKIINEIKTKNIFSSTYRDTFLDKKETDNLENIILSDSIEEVKNILCTPLKYDIFEEDDEQIKKLMKSFWKNYYILIKNAKITSKYDYLIDGKIHCDDYKQTIYDELYKSYLELYNCIFSQYILNEYSEEKLIRMFNKLDTMYFQIQKNDYKYLKENYLGELNELVGLDTIKETLKKIFIYINKNNKENKLNLHMAFYGNPGCGKTEVARTIANVLYVNKVLPTSKFIETDRSGLISQYLGETAIKTLETFKKAIGGVLFIDEAYSLLTDENDPYGKEAISTLIKAMEDYRGKICVILAGYKNPLKKMIDSNPGFQSRIQFHLDFPNYTREELSMIAINTLKKLKYDVEPGALSKILDITDILRKNPNFANAREIRNIIEQVIMCQNIRLGNVESNLISTIDVEKYIDDNKICLPKNKSDKFQSGEEELNNLIGLNKVKLMISKVKAYAKKNKNLSDFNIHMCFNGNPGSGKTEVARILSRILYENGILQEAKVIETDANGLIGKYVGETGPKTKSIIDQAMGGVLFIDEAYILNDNSNNSFGQEAIAVLLKEMEDNRGKFCVILAGYRNEMQHLLLSNPGFSSRIQFYLDFPDYSREELKEIANIMLIKKGYTIHNEILDKVLNIIDFEKTKKNYANARTLRNILDQIIMNQNLRTENERNYCIENIDVDEYLIESGSIKNYSENDYFTENSISMDLSKEYEKITDISIDYIKNAILSLSDGISQSTGFIISSNGLCLTCNHCLTSDNVKARLSLKLPNNRIFKMYYNIKILIRDETNDIALFKLDDDNEFDYIPLVVDNYNYEPLTEFIIAGYPFGGEKYDNISFAEGKIASINFINERRIIFADMFGKSGNSGSPVIDKKTKKVIGIFFGSITEGNYFEEINCFTAIDEIWNLIKKLN